MKNRMIFSTGLAVGYYLGAKAGRKRYEQINTMIARLSNSGAANAASDRAKAAATESFDRARSSVSHKLHHKNGTVTGISEFSPS